MPVSLVSLKAHLEEERSSSKGVNEGYAER